MKKKFQCLRDSDSDAMSEDYHEKVENVKVKPYFISNKDEEDDNIMCCCKKDMQHDETIKFVLKVRPDLENTDILDKTLFTD